jgi:3-hydroxyisobutyrate dehydrogenase
MPSNDVCQERIGFIGLGVMGEPMSLNLVRAGIALIVWNRSPAKSQILADAGAHAAATVDEVFEDASAVFLMLFDRPAIDAVLGRGTPRFATLVAGRTLVNLSSIAPEDSRALERDVLAVGGRFLEAPVSGSRIPAERGQLVAMLAGDHAVADAVRPLLTPMCREAVYCGPAGNALLMKLAVNLFLLVMVTGLTEAVHFADRYGLERERLQAVLDASPMASTVSRLKLASLIASDFTPHAAIAGALNSTQLITAAAAQARTACPLIEACRELYGETAASGLAAQDMMAVIKTMEARSARLQTVPPNETLHTG